MKKEDEQVEQSEVNDDLAAATKLQTELQSFRNDEDEDEDSENYGDYGDYGSQYNRTSP